MFHDYVRKVLKDDGFIEHDISALTDLYRLVGSGSIRNTVRCDEGYPRKDADTGRVVLHLRPIGYPRLPRNVAELRRALIDVLTALGDMHANKFVHRDVRWPNIILLHDGSWMLIDLDFAARLSGGNAPWPAWTRGVPERPSATAGWTCAEDVAQAAALVLDVPCIGAGREAARGVLAKCRTAAEALEMIEGGRVPGL